MKKLCLHYKTIFLAMLIVLFLTSCKAGRFVYYNFAGITDYKIFPVRTAVNDSVEYKYATTQKGKFPKKITLKNKEVTFDGFLENNKTVAFLIIKNDTIQYEKYFNNYKQESVVASFSMANLLLQYL